MSSPKDFEISIHDMPYERINSNCSFEIKNDGLPAVPLYVNSGPKCSCSNKNGSMRLILHKVDAILISSCSMWLRMPLRSKFEQGFVAIRYQRIFFKKQVAASNLKLSLDSTSGSTEASIKSLFILRYCLWTSLINSSIDSASKAKAKKTIIVIKINHSFFERCTFLDSESFFLSFLN